MGWWSATVMGGDPPYDWRDTFSSILGIYNRDAKTSAEMYPFTREVVEKNLDGLIHAAAFEAACEPQDRNVAWQVLAYIMLLTGADFPRPARERMIRAALEDESDNWRLPTERRAYMSDLIEKVKAHKPGVCVELAEEGLFDTIKKGLQVDRELRDIVDRLTSLAAFHGWELDGEKVAKILRKTLVEGDEVEILRPSLNSYEVGEIAVVDQVSGNGVRVVKPVHGGFGMYVALTDVRKKGS